jgi:hypothetical protein
LGQIEHRHLVGQRKYSHSAGVAYHASDKKALALVAIKGFAKQRTEQEEHALRSGKESANADSACAKLFRINGEEEGKRSEG